MLNYKSSEFQVQLALAWGQLEIMRVKLDHRRSIDTQWRKSPKYKESPRETPWDWACRIASLQYYILELYWSWPKLHVFTGPVLQPDDVIQVPGDSRTPSSTVTSTYKSMMTPTTEHRVAVVTGNGIWAILTHCTRRRSASPIITTWLPCSLQLNSDKNCSWLTIHLLEGRTSF